MGYFVTVDTFGRLVSHAQSGPMGGQQQGDWASRHGRGAVPGVKGMKPWSGFLVLLVATPLVAGPALADQQQARFTVAVTVPARVTLEALEPSGSITLSAEDVARGYKDVSASYRVRHNDRRGYLLQIAPRVGLARQVEVRGLGADVVLRDDTIEIHRPGAEFLQDLALEFRLLLDAAAQPGVFPLPVRLAVTPL
jgi:hypothetical protein